MLDSEFIKHIAPLLERYENAKKNRCTLTAQARVRDMVKMYSLLSSKDERTAKCDVTEWLEKVIR